MSEKNLQALLKINKALRMKLKPCYYLHISGCDYAAWTSYRVMPPYKKIAAGMAVGEQRFFNPDNGVETDEDDLVLDNYVMYELFKTNTMKWQGMCEKEIDDSFLKHEIDVYISCKDVNKPRNKFIKPYKKN